MNAFGTRHIHDQVDRELEAGEWVQWIEMPIPRFFTAPEKLQDVFRRERRDGTGDVIIARLGREYDGNRQAEELGFLRIRDPKEIEQMLKKLAEQVAPMQQTPPDR